MYLGVGVNGANPYSQVWFGARFRDGRFQWNANGQDVHCDLYFDNILFWRTPVT